MIIRKYWLAITSIIIAIVFAFIFGLMPYHQQTIICPGPKITHNQRM